MRAYLDHNATTPIAPQVRVAVAAALDLVGNPSSVHAEGRRAREVVEAARRSVAALVGAAAEEVVFTSGGTEADALGVIGLARLARAHGQPAVVLVPAIEHPAVLGAAAALAREGFRVEPVAMSADGVVDVDALVQQCAAGAAVLAVALANHELGTVQDIAALAAAARAHGVRVHCDAVQAAGKLAIDVRALGVNTLALSAHKLYGPKGVGALWVARECELAPLIEGGHQERERRPGTENAPGIVGFGAAAALAATAGLSAQSRVGELRDRLEHGLLQIAGARVHARAAPRVPNTVHAAFDGALGEVVVAGLDLAGVAASTGAACTSGAVQPSPVLVALGVEPARAAEAVRLSLGTGTTESDIGVTLEVLPEIIQRARSHRDL